MICEKEGFIPRYYIDQPNDKVDQTILDMKRYTKTLITEETNLGNLIEEAIKKNEQEDIADKLADDTDTGLGEEEENENSVAALEAALQNDDFSNYAEYIENEAVTDEDLLEFLKQENDS